MNKSGKLLKIIPDELFIQCAQIAWDTRQRAFQVGDIANKIKGQLEAQGRLSELPESLGDRFSLMDVYEVVSIMLNHEFAPRTVREYARVSAVFDANTRIDYDVLPFSHFRFAASLPKPLDGLQISYAEMGRRNGTPPPVAWLEHWFYPTGANPPEPVIYNDLPLSPPGVYEMHDGDMIRVALESPKVLIWHFSEAFESALDELRVPELVRSTIMSLWHQIISILGDYR